MSGKTLPALPAADYVLAVEAQPHKIGWITRDPGYTADQMREYARASLAAQKPQPLPEDLEAQDWCGMDPAIAFHLIERHAENWDHAGRLMEAWRMAQKPQAEPVAPHGLLVTQEPKYTVNGSAIVNRASGQPIPADEPVFVFRARDVHAREAIEAYACVLTPGEHRDAVVRRVADFAAFERAHPERMKEPDTAAAAPPAEKPAEAVAPDGRLHDDGYFTWNTKKHKPYERPAQLPCDFYLAAAQPQKAPQPLTVQAIKAIWSEHPDLSDPGFVLVPFVRAIERAHGIGTKPAEGAL